MLRHNEAQLDFILEMYATDHPDQLKFERVGRKDPGILHTEQQVGWANVLTGRALENYMRRRMPSQGLMERLRGTNAPQGNVVRLGPKS